MISDTSIARKPPGSEEADLAVVSCMMQAPDATIPIAADILRPSDFLTTHAAFLFQFILSRHNSGHPVDPVSVIVALDDPEKLQLAGGAAKISEAYTAAAAPTAVKSYCQTVKDAATLRAVARVASQIEAVAYDRPDDWREQTLTLVSSIDTTLTEVTARKTVAYRDVATEYLDRAIEQEEKDLDPAVSTGIDALDELLDGGIRREYVLIGGKQGGGKTLLAMQIAGNMANSGRRGFVVGYEMQPLQLVMRDLSRESGVPLSIVTGRAKEKRDSGHLRDLMQTIERTSQAWDVHYATDSYLTVEGIASQARALHRIKPLDFIVVDYLQLVPRHTMGRERSDEALKSISEKLQALRRTLNCTLIAPVQLNDDGEVRDARALQDAPETVLKIVMDPVDDDADADSPDLGIIKITKARWGQVGRSCRVVRNGPNQRFEDSDEDMPSKNKDEKRGPFKGKGRY